MKYARLFTVSAATAVAVALAIPTALAIDGTDLPNRYAGFLVASQVNATGYGNSGTTTVNGITVGSELNRLFVKADAQDLWVGITGNLPDRNAESQSIILLIQAAADPGNPPAPNVLETAGLGGFGGGYQSLVGLSGMVLEPGFYPELAIVVNRAGGDPATTYANAWDIRNNFSYEYTSDHVDVNPFFNCVDPQNPNCLGVEPCLMSAYIDTTNILGVTDDETLDGTGPGSQEELAATAVRGLRLRLNRQCFAIGQSVRIMALIASPSGVVSNQFLPPLQNGSDPLAPNCFGSAAEINLETLPGAQFAQIDLTAAANMGTPTANGINGSDIPGGFGIASLVATQQIHTCFGDAVPGQVTINTPGSELDQLFVRRGGTHLQVAFTGNMEGNGNKVYLFLDSKPGGQNTLTANAGGLVNWSGRTFDPGFAADYCYILNHFAGTLYVDIVDIDANSAVYLGSNAVGNTFGLLEGGTNPNNNEFVLNNTNTAGVSGDSGNPGDPSTATTGLEALISLTELGVGSTGCATIGVVAVLGNGGGDYLSNQFLPSLAAGSGNINNDPTDKFNFGLTAGPGGLPAFDGQQYAAGPYPRLGDVNRDCCINNVDVAVFVNVLLGIDTDPVHVFRADVNESGAADGNDVGPLVSAILAEGPCP